MTEEEMLRLAMERSMQDSPPQKQTNFTGLASDDNKSSKHRQITPCKGENSPKNRQITPFKAENSPENRQSTPYKGENSISDSPGVTKTILDACCSEPNTSSPKTEPTNSDHNYVAQEPIDNGIIPCSQNMSSRRGLNLEPPYKRPKIDEDNYDAAYDLFTDIEDKGNCDDGAGSSLPSNAADDVNIQNGNATRCERNTSATDMNISGMF
jgi:hypothetical protein